MKPHALLHLPAAALLALAFLLLGSIQSVFAQGSIRAGDRLIITIAGVGGEEQSAINREYQVDSNGKLKLPYLKTPIDAVGNTPVQLARVIENAYISAQIYLSPTITVTANATSALINMSGQVRSPSRIPFTADMTLLTAINACGGFTPYAAEKRVELTRGQTKMKVDVREIRNDPRKDIILEPGDTIYVPTSPW